MTDFEDKQVANNETMEDAMNSVQEVSVGDIVKGEVLAIEDRFWPELIITMGYSDEQGTASYRLPVEDITDVL